MNTDIHVTMWNLWNEPRSAISDQVFIFNIVSPRGRTLYRRVSQWEQSQ